MSKLPQVLADRQQAFSDAEKAQARANIGAAAQADTGIKKVEHDETLTGNGTVGSELGVANYDDLATKDWVEEQGYSKGSATDLKAGRAITIADDTISSPDTLLLTYPMRVNEQQVIQIPIRKQVMFKFKGAVHSIQQEAATGPTDTIYVFNSVPIYGGVYGLDADGNWQEVLTELPRNFEGDSYRVLTSGPDSDTDARFGLGGLSITEHAMDDDGNQHTYLSGFYSNDAWFKVDDGEVNRVSDLFKNRPIHCVAEWSKTGSAGWTSLNSYMNGEWTKNWSNRNDIDIVVNESGRPRIRNSSGKKIHITARLDVFPQVTAPVTDIWISTLNNAGCMTPFGHFCDINNYESTSGSFNICAQWLNFQDKVQGYAQGLPYDMTFKFVLTVDGYVEG